jgi:hypothetical protein
MLEVVDRRCLQLSGGGLKRIVDGCVQLVAHHEIDHEGRSQDRERNRGGGDECETRAEAHDSRNA